MSNFYCSECGHEEEVEEEPENCPKCGLKVWHVTVNEFGLQVEEVSS